MRQSEDAHIKPEQVNASADGGSLAASIVGTSARADSEENSMLLQAKKNDSSEEEEWSDSTQSEDEVKKDEMTLWRERFNIARNSMLNKFFFLVIAQLGLTCFIWHFTLRPNPDKDVDYSHSPPSITVVISRFLCGIFLHIS